MRKIYKVRAKLEDIIGDSEFDHDTYDRTEEMELSSRHDVKLAKEIFESKHNDKYTSVLKIRSIKLIDIEND